MPDPAREKNPVKRDAIERALRYMALEPNQAVEAIRVDKVFIGSCTNARIEDLRAAAWVVRKLGRRVAPNVRQALVVPSSSLVKAQAETEGLDTIFTDNGFDDIALTLRGADRIREFETERLLRQPWLNLPPLR